MATNKMNFVLELENGQYIRASDQIIRNTEKIEKTSRRTYSNMDSASAAFTKKFRQRFSYLALFGGMFALAYSAVSKFFSSMSAGMGKVIEENNKLKETFKTIGEESSSIFIRLGGSILTSIGPALDVVQKLLISVDDLLKKTNDKRINELKDARKLLLSKNVTKEDLYKYERNYAGKYGGSVLTQKISPFGDKLNINEENKKKLIQDINDELGVYVSIKKAINKEEDKEADKIKKQKALTEATNGYYSALNKVSSELLNTTDIQDEGLKNVKQTLDQWLGVADSIGEAAKAAQELQAAQKAAKDSGKELKVDFSNIISIIGSIVNIIIFIANTYNNMNKSITVTKTMEDFINDLMKERLRLLDEIKKQQEVVAALQEKQALYGNKTEKDLRDALKLKQDELKIAKEITGNYEKQNEENLAAQEFSRSRIEIFKRDLENQRRLGMGQNISTIQGWINYEEAYILELERKRKEIISDITISQTEQAKTLKDIADLEYQITTITNQNLIDRLDLEERIIEARAERTNNYSGEYEMIQQQIQAYEEIITATKKALEMSDSESQIMDYQTTILETQLSIEEKRNQAEELITKQMQKQIDIMRKYVDLGMDLENMRVVKQLTRGFAAQGYSGVELGSQLQNLGVQNKSISGKTLNIFGDINNTLNQASPNVLINNMNEMINRIGGI